MLRNSPTLGATSIGQSTESPHLGRLMNLAGTWLQRRRSRQTLGELNDRLLRDIGLTPSEAIAESTMPFWKPFIWLQGK